MSKFPGLLLFIAIVASITSGTNAQIKNVLLEQHTGAWCGWCVDGTVVMDDIIELYGRNVIGVKIHNGDAMEIPEQRIIGQALGLQGFPTGSIDRKDFEGSVFLGRGSWKASCESQMQQKAKAEVDCFYTLDRRTRTVKIKVMANIVESMGFPLRFNAYIVEDDVTGFGLGYNQRNSIANREGWENHPYFDQPSTIYDYHHMKVVRKMVGGAWGVAGNLPETVQPGEFYTHEFESEIDQSWKIDDLHIVGILQADAEDNKEIINCATAIENGTLLNRIIDSNTPTIQAVPSMSDVNNVYTLENTTDQEQIYTITVSTTERTPADWSAEFVAGGTKLSTADVNNMSGQIIVPANSTAELILTLKVGASLGMGDAEFILDLEGIVTIKRARMITGITTEIEKLLLETESGYSIQSYISDTDHNDIVTLDPDDYMAFADEMTNVKLIVWNKGPTEVLTVDEINIIKNSRNVNHFICGDSVIYSLNFWNALNYFGVEWIGWNIEVEQFTGTVWLSGQQGDVITGNLGENIEGRLIHYYIDMLRITNTDDVFPIMHYQNDGIREQNNSRYAIAAEDTIFGVRIAKNNTRTVLLGITPYIINNRNIRRTLIDNILDWLVSNTDAGN